MAKAYIKEIFESIQGEALYVGEKQLFVRFCGCNLNCDYCDTDFIKCEKFTVAELDKTFVNPIMPLDLENIVDRFDTEVISLTGGEPLLHSDFLLEFLPSLKNKKVYLETNGTLTSELQKLISYIDVVSMDIKLSCSTVQNNLFDKNEEFIQIAKNAGKEIFVKIVLNRQYSKDEIIDAINIIKKYNIPLIIQPMDCADKSLEMNKHDLVELFNFVTKLYPNTRLIPQMHKFLGLL